MASVVATASRFTISISLVCISSPKLIPSPGCRAFFQGSHLAQCASPALSILPPPWNHRWLRFLRPSRMIPNLPQLQAIYHLPIMGFWRRSHPPWSRTIPLPGQSHRAKLQALYLPELLQSPKIFRLQTLQGRTVHLRFTQRQVLCPLMCTLRPVHSIRQTYFGLFMHPHLNRA